MPDPKHTRARRHRTETAGRRCTPLTRRSRTHTFIIADQTPFRALIKVRQPAFNVGAATGRHGEAIKTYGHDSGMPRQRTEDISPFKLRRQLLKQARRIGQHARHLSVEEFEEVRAVIAELAAIHDDDHRCENLCSTYGTPYRPWGTTYRTAWEQAILIVFSRRRRPSTRRP